jgi:hypothetical protein
MYLKIKKYIIVIIMPVKLRLDVDFLKPDINIADELLKLTDTPDSALIVREIHPKNHIHAYLDANLTCKPIRLIIRRMLVDGLPTPIISKKFSVNDVHSDWKGYKGYILKMEDSEIVYAGADVDVDELREYYKDVSKKNKSKKIMTDVLPHVEEGLSELGVYRSVCDYYLVNDMVMCKANINKIVQTILYRRDASFRNRMHLQMAREIEIDHIVQCQLEKEKVKGIVEKGGEEFLTNRQKALIDDPE